MAQQAAQTPGTGAGRERPKTLQEAIERAAQLAARVPAGRRAGSTGRPPTSSRCSSRRCPGMTIDQFVRERIFQPLGMRDTYYNIPQREGESRVAAVYRPGSRRQDHAAAQAGVPRADHVFSRRGRTERHGRRLLPLQPDAAERRRVRRPAAARTDDRRHDVLEPHRRGQAGLHPRRRLRLRPRRRRPHRSGRSRPTRCRSAPGRGAAPTARCSRSTRRRTSIAAPDGPAQPVQRGRNIRPQFSNVVSQAIVDSLADQKPTVMGYATPH